MCGSEENKQSTDNKANFEHMFHFSNCWKIVAQFVKNESFVLRCEG